MKSYKELIVWQKSILLVEQVYKNTQNFPKYELYGLTSQIRRAAVSIPANIAEGYSRRTKKEYRQFIQVAFGSAAELETLLLISRKLKYFKELEYKETNELLVEALKMLNKLLSTLTSR